MSTSVRLISDEHIRTGKKVNPYLNYQVGEKVNLIKRLMKKLMFGLGVNSNSVWSTNRNPSQGSSSTMSLLSFINVSKDISKQGDSTNQARLNILKALFQANDNNRAYYLEEQTKSLFQRCLRLFFFY